MKWKGWARKLIVLEVELNSFNLLLPWNLLLKLFTFWFLHFFSLQTMDGHIISTSLRKRHNQRSLCLMSVSFWLTYIIRLQLKCTETLSRCILLDTLCLVFISGLLLNPFFWHMKRYIVEELWRSTFRMMDISHCYHFHFLDNSQPVSRISWPYFSKDTCVISSSKKTNWSDVWRNPLTQGV